MRKLNLLKVVELTHKIIELGIPSLGVRIGRSSKGSLGLRVVIGLYTLENVVMPFLSILATRIIAEWVISAHYKVGSCLLVVEGVVYWITLTAVHVLGRALLVPAGLLLLLLLPLLLLVLLLLLRVEAPLLLLLLRLLLLLGSELLLRGSSSSLVPLLLGWLLLVLLLLVGGSISGVSTPPLLGWVPRVASIGHISTRMRGSLQFIHLFQGFFPSLKLSRGQKLIGLRIVPVIFLNFCTILLSKNFLDNLRVWLQDMSLHIVYIKLRNFLVTYPL